MVSSREEKLEQLRGERQRIEDDIQNLEDKEQRLEQYKEYRLQVGERIRILREKYGLERTKLSAELGLAANLVGRNNYL